MEQYRLIKINWAHVYRSECLFGPIKKEKKQNVNTIMQSSRMLVYVNIVKHKFVVSTIRR